jgi:outer membrane protein TolC
MLTTARRAAAFLFVVLLPAQPAWSQSGGASQAPLLSIDEAIRIALENSRQVKIARLSVATAADEVAALKTRRRPNVNLQMLAGSLVAPLELTFERGSIGTFSATGPIPAADTRIGNDPQFTGFVFARIAQPLTQLSTIGWGVRALSVGEELAKERVRAQEQTVRNRVQKLYYGILQAASALQANADAQALYQEVDRLVSDYVARQVLLPAEGLAIKTTLARHEQIEIVTRNTIASLKEQLNLVLGRSIVTDFAVMAAPADTAVVADAAALETRALEQRPEVREARLKAQQAEYDLKRSKAAARPEVSVALNYFGFYNVQVLPRNVASLGIYATWEPWDWGRRRLEAASKEHTMEQARLAIGEAEDAVRVDVRARHRQVQETAAALKVTTLAQQTARERLRVATDRFRLEASLHRQVLEAQAALADADQQHQQALTAFWSARADLEKAVGGSDR